MAIKTADSKGRIAFGPSFANKTFIVERVDETEVRVIAASVIPERELWLFRNKKALEMVQRGLQNVKEGNFSKNPPDLDADQALAERCGD